MIKVLIIDDDKLARMGLISLVSWEKCGMTVVGEASNGERGLAFLQENEVDLCVVDLAMPVMPGLEFIKQAKQQHPNLQYVVLSFHEDFQNVQAALRLGTLDYISKMRLEQRDCEEVFLRVGEIMTNMEHSDFSEQEVMLVDADLQEEWLQFRWLYSNQVMEDLIAKTLKKSVSHRWLEHLLVRILDKSLELFEIKGLPSVPSVHHAQTALEWISKLREILRQNLHEKKSSNNEVCIFHAVEYISLHLNENLSIHTVANQVGISRSHFAATFKKITGLTFNTFIRQERVNLAKSLMESGESGPATVSHKVGYEDEQYFCRIFTEQTGMSPSAFFHQVSLK
ncbi:response regulator transcription factor [Scatolibacter rhodanostii]|uniref:response regulator transcription factor n=1 Tax=Scatolibacter rhodanostii TaxID=2014781 RepID=UPI000C06CD07|nr:response regulator [Scatolibacter rhodanostii]